MAKKADRRDQRKDAALTALMESSTFTEAAEKAGVSRRTMYEYLHNDFDFAQQYKMARDRQKLAFWDSLAAHREHALEVVTAILDDAEQPGAVRLKAAQTILETALKQDETISTIARANLNRNDPAENPFGLLSFNE